ncbi:MAG: hypothetical protein IK018_07825 [Lachnospiraceae bacterium]|nr:hypothetical protein [Lachnospiraceae bacterium]
MAKKGKKFLSLMALAAAAAGTYCYLKKKNSNIPENMEDDDDFDNFDVDVDDGPTSRGTSGKRSYVSLDFNSAKEKVMDVASKVAEKAEELSAAAGEKFNAAAGKVEEFFDDRKASDEESAAPTESGEPSEDDYEEPKE